MFLKTIQQPLAIAALLLAAPAWSATLSLVPSTLSIAVGQTLSVDVMVSDLGAGQDLGAFDFNIGHDLASLSFNGYVLGNGLGDLANFEAFDIGQGNLGTGVVNLAEVSLLSDLSGQASAFKLATLQFTATAAGPSSLSISSITLGDAFGTALSATAAPTTISISAVPEPEGFALAGLGLVSLLVLARRRA